MWVCECVSMWVCEYVSMWVCGLCEYVSMGTMWVCDCEYVGYVSVWVCECVCVNTCECMCVHVSVRLCVWECVCVYMWVYRMSEREEEAEAEEEVENERAKDKNTSLWGSFDFFFLSGFVYLSTKYDPMQEYFPWVWVPRIQSSWIICALSFSCLPLYLHLSLSLWGQERQKSFLNPPLLIHHLLAPGIAVRQCAAPVLGPPALTLHCGVLCSVWRV